MDIELLTKVIIPILGAIITWVIVPFIKNTVIPYFESMFTAAQRKFMYETILSAARAAEQVFKDLDPTGAKRKQYVIDYLNTKNIEISTSDFNTLLEDAVLEINIIKGKFK